MLTIAEDLTMVYSYVVYVEFYRSIHDEVLTIAGGPNYGLLTCCLG